MWRKCVNVFSIMYIWSCKTTSPHVPVVGCSVVHRLVGLGSSIDNDGGRVRVVNSQSVWIVSVFINDPNGMDTGWLFPAWSCPPGYAGDHVAGHVGPIGDHMAASMHWPCSADSSVSGSWSLSEECAWSDRVPPVIARMSWATWRCRWAEDGVPVRVCLHDQWWPPCLALRGCHAHIKVTYCWREAAAVSSRQQQVGINGYWLLTPLAQCGLPTKEKWVVLQDTQQARRHTRPT
jgi:hypothetical protein